MQAHAWKLDRTSPPHNRTDCNAPPCLLSAFLASHRPMTWSMNRPHMRPNLRLIPFSWPQSIESSIFHSISDDMVFPLPSAVIDSISYRGVFTKRQECTCVLRCFLIHHLKAGQNPGGRIKFGFPGPIEGTVRTALQSPRLESTEMWKA